MTEKRLLTTIAVLLALLVVSAGCIGNPFAEDEEKEKKVSVTLIMDDQTVAREDNLTFVALAKNLMDKTVITTFHIKGLPNNFEAEILNDTFEMKRARQRATLVRVFIGEDANLGNHKFRVKVKMTNKTTVKASKKMRVRVLPAEEGDVRSGDTVMVDYTGFLDNGRVFDTSVKDIGTNTNIKKSEEWQGHGDTYNPLSVKIDAGSVVEGFNDGIKGLSIGQSRTIFVPPEEGYANIQNVTINKTERMRMVQEMGWNEFVAKYGESPVENKVVTDGFWGWSVQVLDLEDKNVTIMINPQALVNETITPYGWESRIVSVDSMANDGDGEIVIEHEPTKDVNVTYKGFNGWITDETDDTVTITYNSSQNPLGDKNLWFHITLVKIQV